MSLIYEVDQSGVGVFSLWERGTNNNRLIATFTDKADAEFVRDVYEDTEELPDDAPAEPSVAERIIERLGEFTERLEAGEMPVVRHSFTGVPLASYRPAERWHWNRTHTRAVRHEDVAEFYLVKVLSRLQQLWLRPRGGAATMFLAEFTDLGEAKRHLAELIAGGPPPAKPAMQAVQQTPAPVQLKSAGPVTVPREQMAEPIPDEPTEEFCPACQTKNGLPTIHVQAGASVGCAKCQTILVASFPALVDGISGMRCHCPCGFEFNAVHRTMVIRTARPEPTHLERSYYCHGCGCDPRPQDAEQYNATASSEVDEWVEEIRKRAADAHVEPDDDATETESETESEAEQVADRALRGVIPWPADPGLEAQLRERLSSAAGEPAAACVCGGDVAGTPHSVWCSRA